VNDYLLGSTLQLKERARHLIGLIPRNLGRDVDGLIAMCRTTLGGVVDRLEWLATAPEMLIPENQGVRLRHLRRVVSELNYIETSVIAALVRWHPQYDGVMNGLVDRLSHEIQFPLSAPVVSCTSRDYFCIHPRWNLLCVQPAEGHFLLHLPDLYHELGHPLLTTENDPRVEPFQRAYVKAVNDAHGYIAAELQRENTGRSPVGFQRTLTAWLFSWNDWAIELFCDLFATFTLGPAYAWAHHHLHASRGTDPFHVPQVRQTSHPADSARMEVMLLALCRIGYQTEAIRIRTRWEQLLRTSNAESTPAYRRCFPDSLLGCLTQLCHDGVGQIGCKLASVGMSEAVRSLLNEAWDKFWLAPRDYPVWERTAVARLQQTVP